MEIFGSLLTVVVVIWLYVSARDWLADLRAELVEIRNQTLAARRELAEHNAHLAELNLACATEFQDLRERLADRILDRLDT